MIESWQAVRQRLQAATLAMYDAEDRCRTVAVPEAMFQTEADIDLFDCAYGRTFDEERRWYSPDSTGHRYFKSIAGLMERHGCNGKNAPARLERAREIIAAIEVYSADRRAAERECGFDVAEAEEERLSAESMEKAVQIIKAPAHTFQGVLRKTALLADIYPGGADYDCIHHALERRLTKEYALDDAIAYGLARDLMELAKTG